MAKAIIQLSNVNHFKGKAKFIICPFISCKRSPEISKKKTLSNGMVHYITGSKAFHYTAQQY